MTKQATFNVNGREYTIAKGDEVAVFQFGGLCVERTTVRSIGPKMLKTVDGWHVPTDRNDAWYGARVVVPADELPIHRVIFELLSHGSTSLSLEDASLVAERVVQHASPTGAACLFRDALVRAGSYRAKWSDAALVRYVFPGLS